jgi:hypothetical protein
MGTKGMGWMMISPLMTVNGPHLSLKSRPHVSLKTRPHIPTCHPLSNSFLEMYMYILDLYESWANLRIYRSFLACSWADINLVILNELRTWYIMLF